jgi:hypothetical protein
MVETLMFEGLQRNMGEVRAAARVHDDTSAAGPRPERPPLAQRQAILAGLLVLKKRNVEHSHSLQAQGHFPMGSKHSRRLGMFHEVDLRGRLDE